MNSDIEEYHRELTRTLECNPAQETGIERYWREQREALDRRYHPLYRLNPETGEITECGVTRFDSPTDWSMSPTAQKAGHVPSLKFSE